MTGTVIVVPTAGSEGRPGCGHAWFSAFGARTSWKALQVLIQALFWTLLTLNGRGLGQTASTGALKGEVSDPSGKGIGHVSVEVKNQEMAVIHSTLSDDEGRFVLPLLSPGTYEVQVSKSGYSDVVPTSVQIRVTETILLFLSMNVTGQTEMIEVHATVSGVQADSVALGRVVDEQTIQALPLAARNFTQIVDLSPGVLTGVNNAGELGPGGSGLAQIDAGNDGIFVHGSRPYDNSYEFDGIPVTK